jgi:hypothetical protein
MSVRENLEIYGLQDEERYINVLTDEFGGTRHPSQEGAYILEALPFYAPRLADDHISLLGFNNTPLPDSLIQALVDHINTGDSTGSLPRYCVERALSMERALLLLQPYSYRGESRSAF